MQFKDQIDFVRQHIKKNRMRVFMTVLAATMGTAFLIVLASVGFGIHETVRGGILSDRKVTEIQVYSGEDFSEETINRMKHLENVNAVVNRQELSVGGETRFKDLLGYNRMIVTDFIEEAKVGFKLAEGRLPQAPYEVVVGSHFTTYLHPEDMKDEEEIEAYSGKVLGEQFQVTLESEDDELKNEPITFTIVGIGEAPAREWFTDEKIYADATIIPEIEKVFYAHVEEVADGEVDAMQLFYSNLNVYANNLENVKPIANSLKEEGYSVYSVADELDQIDVFFLALKAGLVFVGTIAILIASIGIFNTMTMAVTERTREIGVMKAIGANPKLIQRLFLMESAWIGVVGTVLAIVISYGVSILSNYLLPIIVTAALGEEDFGGMEVTFSIIPWQLILIASAISISVAMISGWRPARKATKIDVIQALRQEL